MHRLIAELYRVTKQGGIVVWVCADRVKDGTETGTSFRTALDFMAAGFNLHDTMIWRKTNPMPRVKTKRYRDSFEYMFVFSKGRPETFNPLLVECKCAGKTYDSTCKNIGGENGRTHKTFKINAQRYKDNVWDIAVAQNKTGHPGVFPAQLARDHITTWTNPGDVVLDPMCGSGTTLAEAVKAGRDAIGIDISESYCKMARQMLDDCGAKVVDDGCGAN